MGSILDQETKILDAAMWPPPKKKLLQLSSRMLYDFKVIKFFKSKFGLIYKWIKEYIIIVY